MVGVPGKFKGCNTCRARRVKCDNQRPFCRKCTDSGRECQGYERETVFIVGTLEDKGRCSSHPPRNSKTPRGSPSPATSITPNPASTSNAQLVPAEPLRSAWDDVISLSKSGKTYRLRIAALYMPVNTFHRPNSAGDRITSLSLPSYTPVNIQPQFGDEGYQLSAQCLTSVEPSSDGTMLYLFNHNSPLAHTGLSPWKAPSIQEDSIRRKGPESFEIFPDHHFFVRVYRPAAIVAALLDRKPTFCGETEWVTTPWKRHPKGPLDHLLDILSQVPPLLQRFDHLINLEPTTVRRFMTQDLLENCLNVQTALDQWHTSLHQSIYSTHPAYWISHDPQSGNAHIPFGEPVSFRDPLTALTFIYYWAAQILFYPCIGLLSHTIFAPVIDVYHTDPFSEVPPHLHIDLAAYGTDKMRSVAANMCRGLDSALTSTTQPDLLAFPVQVAETFYEGMSVVGEGAMELMWLNAFRNRLADRGRALAGAMMSKGWQDLAEW